MNDLIMIRNNSHQCSYNTHEDETSISIYSAKLLNPCSNSQRLLINFILLFVLLINNIR